MAPGNEPISYPTWDDVFMLGDIINASFDIDPMLVYV